MACIPPAMPPPLTQGRLPRIERMAYKSGMCQFIADFSSPDNRTIWCGPIQRYWRNIQRLPTSSIKLHGSFLLTFTLPLMWSCVYWPPVLNFRCPDRRIAISPLEKLFQLELDFHRRLRTEAPVTADATGLRTSYALQTGYEQLIPAVGTINARQIEQLRERITLAEDTRDLLAAHDSLKQLLGLPLLDA